MITYNNIQSNTWRREIFCLLFILYLNIREIIWHNDILKNKLKLLHFSNPYENSKELCDLIFSITCSEGGNFPPISETALLNIFPISFFFQVYTIDTFSDGTDFLVEVYNGAPIEYQILMSSTHRMAVFHFSTTPSGGFGAYITKSN